MRTYQLGLLYVFLACGCGSHQDQAQVAPLPPPPVYVPPPDADQATSTDATPLRASECKTYSEGCIADGSSRLHVAAVATLSPPSGWAYTITPDRGLRMIAPDGGATMAFERVDSTKPDVVWPQLYAILTEIHVRGVVPEAITLAQPQGEWPAQGLSVRLWQVEESQRIGGNAHAKDPDMNGERGALLVGITEIDPANAVLGIGFLKRSAPKALVSSIRQTMESLSAQSQDTTASTPTPPPVPATRP